MTQAVIFDLDGTLTDTEALWDEVRRDLAAADGLQWTTESSLATMGMSTTAMPRSVMPCSRIMWIAVLPNTVIHSRVKAVGTSSTPVTNSRMVRPREIRAMNSPTNGDQASHQPQ